MRKRIPFRRKFERLKGTFLCQKPLDTYSINGDAINLVSDAVQIYIITMNNHTG